MTAFYFWFFPFAILFYLVITDETIAMAINLLMKLFVFHYEKTKWWILHNPSNPIVKYLMWRRSLNLAIKLQRELAGKNKK